MTIANGKKRWVYFDGTNFVDAVTTSPPGTTINNSVLVTETGTQTLTIKTLTAPTITVRDNVLTITDNTDTTKAMQLELSALTTGVTAAVSMPAVTAGAATLVTANATQTLTNKTITIADSALTIQDYGDPTKQAQFQASGISAGATRVVTIPNSDGTILYTNGSGSSLTGIRIQGKETIWMPAGAMVSPSSNGAAAGTTNGTNVVYKTLDFDKDTSESAQFQIAMPRAGTSAAFLSSPTGQPRLAPLQKPASSPFRRQPFQMTKSLMQPSLGAVVQ